MKIVYFKRWERETASLEHPNLLFVFGDNLIKKGRLGQAIIRGLPNAFGIPTKKLPSRFNHAYFSDNEYAENCKHIAAALSNIRENLNTYVGVAFPSDGIGTGLAKMKEMAPKTFDYLVAAIEQFKEEITNGGTDTPATATTASDEK